jgi:archaetidylinositol phosphate synthase
MTTDARTHVRENGGLLAAAEKRLLIRMAQRLPAWVTADHLTVLGLAAMAMAGLSFWAARYYRPALVFVVVALAVNWFGDSLDGTVARVREQERPRYGFYVDHVLDLVGTTFLLVGLSLSGFMTPVVALAMLVAYLLVTAEVFLATAVRSVFRMSFLVFGPTELRIVLSIGALYLLRKPTVELAGYGPYFLFDIGGVVTIAGLIGALVLSTARNTRALYLAEPLPDRRKAA